MRSGQHDRGPAHAAGELLPPAALADEVEPAPAAGGVHAQVAAAAQGGHLGGRRVHLGVVPSGARRHHGEPGGGPQGRVFMRELIDCPFRTVESVLTYLKSKTNIIFVDMHAETTSEKIGIGWFLDGKVSGVVGTHTHVQTADERVLPGGTAFITDLGMCGSWNSMIGMKKEPIIQHFLYQMPVKFVVETSSPVIMCGVWIEVDTATGKATKIERVRVIDNDLNVDSLED